MQELKQFIQGSGTKAVNESVCSIQVRTEMFQEPAHPRNSIGSSKGFNNSGLQNPSKYVAQALKEQNDSLIEINEMENSEKAMNSPQKSMNSPQKVMNSP